MGFDNTDRTELTRRTFIGTTGLGLIGASLPGAARTDPGDGDGGDGGDGGGGGSDDTPPSGDEWAVTLVTGQTVYVADTGTDRVYTVDNGDDEVYDIIERDDGTYIIPASAETTVYSDLLFNVDFLIEQGFTDAETDSIPLIVSYEDKVPGTRDVGGLSADRQFDSIGAAAVSVPKTQASATARSLTAVTGIERVSLDRKYEALLDVSAPAIGLPEARDAYGVDGSDVTVGVVDTGIDSDHPDLADRIVDAADFTGEGSGDENGHGTHVAGIAAGDGTESDGEYVGAAPGASLLDVKVLGAAGSGQTSGIIEGIEWAVGAGADVINLSLGGAPQADDPLDEAIDWVHEQGVVPVVSAGNVTLGSEYGDVSSPGTAAGSITVGATDYTADEPQLADFSAFGPEPFDYRIKPDVVAPGVELTAAGSDDAGEAPYTDKSGTSMSAPVVAGLAALLLEDDSELDPEAVRSRLLGTATPVDDDGTGRAADVFQAGAGEVAPERALDSTLLVHDPVVDFGLMQTGETDDASVTVENVGEEPLEIEADASLRNVTDDEEDSASVALEPDSFTLEAGKTESVSVDVDAGEAYGHNAGVVSFEADDETYRAVFGFTAGLDVTVEKTGHERTDEGTVAGDRVWLWSQDGAVDTDATLGADGRASFLLFEEEATVTAWSSGDLEPTDEQLDAPVDNPSGDPVLTIESDVHVDADNDHIHLDENETVERALDSDALEEAEPFVWREYAATLFAIQDTGSFTYARRFVGDFRVRDARVSPLAADDPTNVATDYLFAPGDEVADGDVAFESPTLYYLFDGTESIDEDGEPYAVDPDDLAAERITYHHDYEDQVFTILPGIFPADRERFPMGIGISYGTDVPGLPATQTWYRTDTAEYTDDWDDAEDDSNYGVSTNVGAYVPDAGAEYHSDLNREPLLGSLSEWALGDDDGTGTLDLTGHWYTDQAEVARAVMRWDHDNPNEYELAVDGETVLEGDGIGSAFLETVTDIEPGSTVELSTAGNAVETFRGTSTVTRYETTYDPDGDSTPPQPTHVDVAGLTTLNEIPGGVIVVFVETSAPLETFEAYVGDEDADTSPFDDDSAWRTPEVVYAEDETYALRVDATGHDELAFAFRGVDAAGNAVESTSIGGITVLEGADAGVSIEVRPDEIDAGSNQAIPVVIEPTDGIAPHEIDVDSLRFGAPDAVAAGDGASADGTQRQGNGRLLVRFPANETGYEIDHEPGAASLRGRLEDGTELSGADLVDVIYGP